MKLEFLSIVLFSVFMAISFTSCSSDSEPEIHTGDVFFYIDRDWLCGEITVQLENQTTKTITTFYSGGFVTCEDNPEAIYRTINHGSYTWTARGFGGCYWEGSITLNTDCLPIMLTESDFSNKCELVENDPCLSVEFESGVSEACGPGAGSDIQYFRVTNNCEEAKQVFVCYESFEGKTGAEDFVLGIQMGQTKEISICVDSLVAYKLVSQSLSDFQDFNCALIPVDCE